MEKLLREKLAAYVHNAWSGWMKYLFMKSIENDDGTVTIPKWAVDRWKKQMDTRYTKLVKVEKDSDREEANTIIRILSNLENY